MRGYWDGQRNYVGENDGREIRTRVLRVYARGVSRLLELEVGRPKLDFLKPGLGVDVVV